MKKVIQNQRGESLLEIAIGIILVPIILYIVFMSVNWLADILN